MDLLVKIFFFLVVFLILWSYILYPISLFFINKIISKKYKISYENKPAVSIIISAYNEENVIEKTIRNFLKSDYGPGKTEIVIGSDNSTDKTNEIVEKLKTEFSNIIFFPFNERRGKAEVLNDLTSAAKGEILIFSDANTMFSKNSIGELVKYFVDDRIGGVCGKLVLLDLETAKNEGVCEKEYWEYESWIKFMEGQLGILIGANGGIYAIRKELYKKIPSKFPVMDDFYMGLKILEQNKDLYYAKEAIATEYVAPSVEWEFKRKVRIISINLDTLRYVKNLLSPKYGLISYAFWSHKMIRWITPILLFMIFLLNIFILYNPVFEYLFYLQLLFYLSALVGYLLSKAKISGKLFSLTYYFVMTNVAIIVGMYHFISKKQSASWQSTERNL